MNREILDKSSFLESVAGSKSTAIATTLIAAFSGTPLAALLPVLTGALANDRHKKRIEKAIEEISVELERLKDKIHVMSDSQYKIVNETILTIFQTTEDEKIEYLRNVVRNVVSTKVASHHEAALISRLIRDLSAEEVSFIINNGKFERISLGDSKPFDQRSLKVSLDSNEALVVNGLISLGLLIPAEPSGNENILLRFAPIIPKLLALLRNQ